MVVLQCTYTHKMFTWFQPLSLAFLCYNHSMESVGSYARLYRDRLIVFSYVIFAAAAIIIYPVRTTEIETSVIKFENCGGEWASGATSTVQCSLEASSTIPINPVSAQIKVIYHEVSTSTVQAAGIIESEEVLVEPLVVVSQKAAENEPVLIENNLPETLSAAPELLSTSTIDIVPNAATSSSDISLILGNTPEITTTVIQATTTTSTSENFATIEYSFNNTDWILVESLSDLSVGEAYIPIPSEHVLSEKLAAIKIRLVGAGMQTHNFVIDEVLLFIGHRNNEVLDGFSEVIPEITIPKKAEEVIEKPPQFLFESSSIEIVPVVAPPQEEVQIDLTAMQTCEVVPYQLRVSSAAAHHEDIQVMLSGMNAATSSLRVVNVPDGLTLTFDNTSKEVELSPTQISAKLHIDIPEKIDGRSFNIPIIYSGKNLDGLVSNAACQFNVVVE